MCSPLLAVQGIGVGLQVAGTISAGKAQAKAHKAQAHQYETQRIEAATEASQAARDRFEEFQDLENANRVAIAASGLSTKSFDAVIEGNRLQALEDVGRIEDQGEIKQNRIKFAASNERAAATNASRGAIINGIAQGLMGAADIWSTAKGT